MALYTFNVTVGPNQLEVLKGSSYNLCIAKPVNGTYTVVWSGNTEYLHENKFQWTEDYEVFGVQKFKAGALVEATTTPEPIKYGQICDLDSQGIMGPAKGNPDPSTGSFHVKNEFGEISIGVGSSLNGNPPTPIFASPPLVSGTASFKPIVSIKAWFSVEQKSSTMIFDADSESIEISFAPGTQTMGVAYQGDKPGLAKWTQL